jgi:hypothetical protein
MRERLAQQRLVGERVIDGDARGVAHLDLLMP